MHWLTVIFAASAGAVAADIIPKLSTIVRVNRMDFCT
jgi:hypothetical protein